MQKRKLIPWEGDFEELYVGDRSVGIGGFSAEEARDILLKEAKTKKDKEKILKVYRMVKRSERAESRMDDRMELEWLKSLETMTSEQKERYRYLKKKFGKSKSMWK
jgi:hypothetical protein